MRLRWFPSAIGCAAIALTTVLAPSMCLAQSKTSPGTAPKAAVEASDSDDDSVVIVAFNSIDSVVPNIQHIARLVGAGAAGGAVSTAVNQYSNGIDRNRPFGLFVSFDDSNNPVPIGCLPITDLDAFFEQLSIFGEANDLGDGLYEFNIGNSIYAKKDGEWLYIARAESDLEDIDSNLATGLAKIVGKYDVRIQLNPQNIPEDMVGFFTNQLRAGLAQGMAAQSNMDDEDAEAAQAASEQMIKDMEEAIEATEKVIVGISINKQDKKTTIDFGSQFEADSKFAKQIDKLKNSKSSFAGVAQDKSMMTLQAFQLVEADQISQLERTLETSLKAAFKSVDENSKDKASADRAKELINKAVDILVESAKKGQIESAVDVSVEKDLGIIASVGVADGAKVEALAAEIAKEVAKEAGPVQLKINTGKHAGFNLHKATVAIPPQADEAKKIFGDSVTIAIGTSPKSVFLSVGKNCDAGLKSAIDRAAAAKPASPADAFKMRLGLSQLLNYINSIESTPITEAMIGAATAGNDRIMIDSQLVPRGLVFRTTLEDGVLKAISAGVKAGQGGGAGF